MIAFKGSFKEGDSGLDVAGVKRALKYGLGYRRVKLGRSFGPAASAALKAFQRNHGLEPDGVYGAHTHAKFASHLTGYAGLLYRSAKIRQHSRQIPPLPRFFYRPLGRLLRGSGAWGLQPWIAPQVEAICKEFGLQVSGGYGGTPPHASDSDHKWGGAVDLIGGASAMAAANEWADGLRGTIFRWVGGPAHDADGVETGHLYHVHLSWFHTRATTIFGTRRFK